MMFNYVNHVLIACMLLAGRVIAEPLTLSEAIEKGCGNNASLRACSLRIGAAKIRIDQAGTYANPEFSAGIEGLKADEVELTVSHTIESGKKRSLRMAAVAAEVDPLAMDYALRRNEIAAEIKRKFCMILSLESKEAAIDSLITSASTIHEATRKRFEAGAAMRLDVLRAGMALIRLDNELKAVQREKQRHLLGLKVVTGDTSDALPGVKGRLNHAVAQPGLPECVDALKEHPSQKKYRSQLSLGKAQLQRVQTEWLPDISLTAGYLRDNERGENKPVLGAGVVLPLFNRNRSETAAVKEDLLVVESSARHELLLRKSEIERTLLEISGCDESIGTLQNKTLPLSVEVYQELVRIFQNGGCSFIEVTEAQTGLMQYQMELIELQLERLLYFVTLEEMTGISFSVIK